MNQEEIDPTTALCPAMDMPRESFSSARHDTVDTELAHMGSFGTGPVATFVHAAAAMQTQRAIWGGRSMHVLCSAIPQLTHDRALLDVISVTRVSAKGNEVWSLDLLETHGAS